MLSVLKESLVNLGPRHPAVRFGLAAAGSVKGWRVRFQGQAIHLSRQGREYIFAEKDFAYIPLMFDQALVYFKPVQPDRPNCWDYSTPGWHRYIESGLDFFMPSFPEDESIATYCRYHMPKEGDLIWDAGAHAGVSTYSLSKLVGASGTVVAWEPDAICFNSLLRNLDKHHLQNVIPLNKALSDRTGKALFKTEGTMGSALSHLASYPSTARVSEVETTSLEDACDEFGRPSFIKMDIEGAEKAVVQNSVNFLRQHPIEFAIETHHWVDGRYTCKDMEDLFPQCGYEVRTGTPEGSFFTWASPHPFPAVA